MPTLISGSTGVNKITDGTIVNADIASGGAIARSKLGDVTGFHAHNSGIQSISSGTTTKILFFFVVFDNGSDFASSRFTVPSDGKYYLYSHLQLTAMADQGFANLVIRKNADSDFNMVYNTVRGSGTGYVSNNAFVTVDADADDYFEVFLYNSASCNVDYNAAGAYAFFGGFKL